MPCSVITASPPVLCPPAPLPWAWKNQSHVWGHSYTRKLGEPSVLCSQGKLANGINSVRGAPTVEAHCPALVSHPRRPEVYANNTSEHPPKNQYGALVGEA